jgi:dTDP-4-dehydrorhamnose 3,5-epimerase
MGLIASPKDMRIQQLPMPEGVQMLPLRPHRDDRGTFTELYRDEWFSGPRPVQWNMVRSAANVLRGVHVHTRHVDFLTMAQGEMILGLRDLRPSSRTFGLSVLLRHSAEDPHMAVIPVGVAHGFYFPEPACHIYSVTETFDGSDEFGCRWDDPGLELIWPCTDPILSERDRNAGSLSELMSIAASLEHA